MPPLCPVVQWSVHWALSRMTRVLVLAGARRCALETCVEKKCELRFYAWLNLYIIIIVVAWLALGPDRAKSIFTTIDSNVAI